MRFVLGAFKRCSQVYRPLLEMLQHRFLFGISQLKTTLSLESKGRRWREEFVRHPGDLDRNLQRRIRRREQAGTSCVSADSAPFPLCREDKRCFPGRNFRGGFLPCWRRSRWRRIFQPIVQSWRRRGKLPCSQAAAGMELLMEVLDQMHSILGRRKVARERYYSLLKEVIAGEDVSEIPRRWTR